MKNKDGVAVYCKCGMIIYAATKQIYKSDKETKKDVDSYFDRGYKIGLASKEEVVELFGCKC